MSSGWYINVAIYNYTDSPFTLSTKNAEKGSFENGPVETICPVDNGEECIANGGSSGHDPVAFTGYSKEESDTTEGYVIYDLPNNVQMKISYQGKEQLVDDYSGPDTAVFDAGNVFVELQSQEENSKGNTATNSYFVTMNNSSQAPERESHEDNDVMTTTIYVYSSSATSFVQATDNHISDSKINTTLIKINNQSGKWLTLHDYSSPQYTYPPTIVNGTTSVAPGQNTSVLNYVAGSKDEGLVYNLTNDLLFTITPGGKKEAPTWSFSSNEGYTASCSPDSDGADVYTVTVFAPTY